MRKIPCFLLVAATILCLQGAPSSLLDTKLLAAAEHGDAGEARSLLGSGANPNAANTDGNTLTALMLASRGGHSSVVRILLAAGAKVEATAAVRVGVSGANEGLTALMGAAASGDTATVELLLERKANPNAKSVFKTNSSSGGRAENFLPLIMNSANLAVLRTLAEHGADLHAKNGDGDSVLMYAAEHLDPPAVQYLLSKGLDPRERNNEGKTALDLAMEAGKADSVEILKKAVR
jgi:ankyrin repeat protein